MKYIAVFDDEMLQDFRLGDMGLTLIATGLSGKWHKLPLKMIIKPVAVNTDGESIYLTEGHIKALTDYEQGVLTERAIKRMADVCQLESQYLEQGITQGIV